MMKKRIIHNLLILTLSMFHLQTMAKGFQLLPQPQLTVYLPGKGIDYKELTYIFAESDTIIPVLGSITDGLPRCKKQGKGIELKISGSDVPESSEGYVVEITAKGIQISSRSKSGLFYGCQTLEQLLEDSRDFSLKIPSMRITDYPAIAYRAVHLDTKHHLDKMDYYYRMMDKLARYKINAVIWEIEDKLRYTRRPEIASPNAISKQEIQALCRYAKERNIEISPLVQGLGHAAFILKHHWELRENPASDWEFCPSNPLTYEMQFDLYRDALEAMPHGKYLHVGGDEITAIGIDERCKATGKTAFELQMEWLKKVCRFAVEQGRQPIFWDDMPLKYAGVYRSMYKNLTKEEADTINMDKMDAAIELFPKECIYMRWNYGDATTPAHKRILNWYRNKGLKVMAATAAATGGSLILPHKNHVRHIKDYSSLVLENRFEGILATVWDDISPHLETVWRGCIAQGEYGWNPNTRDEEAFSKAYAQREFGFRPEEDRLDFLNDLGKSAAFYDDALIDFTDTARWNSRWNPDVILYEKLEKLSGNPEAARLLRLPDKANPGLWSQNHEEKIEKAKEEAKRHEKTDAAIKTAKQNALRNRYTLEIYEQSNHLLNFPVRMLLALSAYDTAPDETARKSAMEEISRVCDYFTLMRSNLEQVYSQTRFMENPEGYIAEQNHHHHLAAMTQNSDWMFLLEIAVVQKVKDWVSSNL